MKCLQKRMCLDRLPPTLDALVMVAAPPHPPPKFFLIGGGGLTKKLNLVGGGGAKFKGGPKILGEAYEPRRCHGFCVKKYSFMLIRF